ncbi:MAG: MFS transporter [Gammaproteobacteria bacterium]|nr:MFS transporter [Gammaproteobacteria bacterium]
MSRDKSLLLFGLVTYGIGQSLLYVVFGPLARDIGLTEFQFGVLIASSNIAIVIFSPMWGRASQSKGRKPIFIIGLVGYALGYGLLAFGIQAGLWTMLVATPLFWALLGARLLYGVVASAISPAATAYVADTTDEGNRAAGMALVAASSGIGTIFGPFLGGLLAQVGPVVPMYAASLLAIVAAILSALKLEEPPRHAEMKEDVSVSVFDRRIFPYLFGWFVIFMVFTAVQVITAFYIEDQFGISDSGEVIKVASIALFVMAIVTLVAQVAIMTVWKLSPKVLLRTSFFIYAAVLLVFANTNSLLALYLCFAGLGFSFALAVPGLNAAASLAVEAHEQGAVAGWLSSAPAFGMIFGPALGGYFYAFSPSLPMTAGAILSGFVGVMFWLTNIPDPKPSEEGPSEEKPAESESA